MKKYLQILVFGLLVFMINGCNSVSTINNIISLDTSNSVYDKYQMKKSLDNHIVNPSLEAKKEECRKQNKTWRFGNNNEIVCSVDLPIKRKYNKDGFDDRGIHKDTGTEYNLQGLNRGGYSKEDMDRMN